MTYKADLCAMEFYFCLFLLRQCRNYTVKVK